MKMLKDTLAMVAQAFLIYAVALGAYWGLVG
jgi:hypothetical protein